MFEEITLFLYYEKVAFSIKLIFIFTIFMVFYYGTKYDIVYKKFKKITKLEFYNLFSEYRIGNEGSLESDSLTLLYFIHKKKFLLSNDSKYIELGNKTFKSSLKFIKSLAFSFALFVFIIFLYGEQIRG